jgi:lipoprotein-anchoring transpeptidase ErfK/SrfK
MVERGISVGKVSKLSRDFGRRSAAGLASVALAAAIVCELSAPAAAERPERYQRERYSERYQSERDQDRRYREDREETQTRRAAAEAPAPEPIKPEGPLTMFVSLNKQRMYVYDSKGLFTQTRISSGQKGFDTPVGIYSILEKNEVHASNIYESASMPHMQRLTQTGIALHGGVVPGYAASHGCVRLPFEFATKFFGLTDINQRVVIAPDAQAPVEIDHPLLFAALPRGAVASVSSELAPKSGDESGLQRIASMADIAPRTLLSVAEDRAQERIRLVDAAAAAREAITTAEAGLPQASRAADDAKKALRRAQGVADAAKRNASKAAKAKSGAESTLASISKRLAGDTSKMKSDKLEALRKDETETRDRIPALATAADQAAAEAERTTKEAQGLQVAYKEAEAARLKAKAAIKTTVAEEKKAAKAVEIFDRQERNRDLPVSIFISSKTSTIKVRQGWENIYEGPVTIESPEQPLGTYLMSATGWRDTSQTSIKWSTAAVSENPLDREAVSEDDEFNGKRKSKKAETSFAPPAQTDRATATATLDRIKIPQEAIEKITEVVKPGSTFIVSDYDVSKSEMRYLGTDFIVQMPEVVAKISRPKPKRDEYYDDDDYGWSFFGGSNYQKKRSRPYGGKFYF